MERGKNDGSDGRDPVVDGGDDQGGGAPEWLDAGKRYRGINTLGEGAAGTVYRVLDRLSGRVITLKKLKAGGLERADDDTLSDMLMLAREFRVLASLRHPNIISVLDYGFDAERRPYYTMDLQENARTITDAGHGQPMNVRVELLVQMLHALVYLHRRGILHRDVKPTNVLVVGNQVRVLDFGLSVRIETVEDERDPGAGTLAYLAPELLQEGGRPSVRSDIFSAGMIAYELIFERHPYEDSGGMSPLAMMLAGVVEVPEGGPEPRLRPVLQRMLAGDPRERFGSAEEVIAALEQALGHPHSPPSPVILESFLQAAALVGRDREREELERLLEQTIAGEGGLCLIGGESGVGKTRLVNEARTMALVRGMFVADGQAVREGGGAYHVWRSALRSLVLRLEPDDDGASVLKGLVPDVGALLGRPVPDPPPADGATRQFRLRMAVDALLRGATEPALPMLIVLEDLHWADSQSMELLRFLSAAGEAGPVLILGTYRNDERPELSGHLPDARQMSLERLPNLDIGALAVSMVGEAGRRPELVRLLEKETEGNPFFLVEVMRELAERAGGLDRIGEMELPDRVTPGGLKALVRARLDRAPSEDVPMLEAAAVLGRDVDLEVLGSAFPGSEAERWAASCASKAILDAANRGWAFAHDKLREQLLADLPAERKRSLHARIAAAIEQVRGDNRDQLPALAHHWREAEQPARELEYAARAGHAALQSGANEEASSFLARSVALLEGAGPDSEGTSVPALPLWRRLAPSVLLDPNAGSDPTSRSFRRCTMERGLAEASYRLGDLARCRTHARRSLEALGVKLPSGKLGWILATLRQAGLRVAQVLFRVRTRDRATAKPVASVVARALLRMSETFFYGLDAVPLVWSTLRLVNHCEPLGPSPPLAHGKVMMGLIADVTTLRPVARRWCRQALDIAERTGTKSDVALILHRIGIQHLAACRWEEAAAFFDRCGNMATGAGDRRLAEEAYVTHAAMGIFTARYQESLAHFDKVRDSARRSGNRQLEAWGIIGWADVMQRLGMVPKAAELYERAVSMLDERAVKTDSLWYRGMYGLVLLRSGDREGALREAEHALDAANGSIPLAYWLQHGIAGMVEVFLDLLEEAQRDGDGEARALRNKARRACKVLRAHARLFRLSRPMWLFHDARRAWLDGDTRRAVRGWRRCIELADTFGTPHEAGWAHLRLGLHLEDGADVRRAHLERAREVFDGIGASADRERAEGALAELG